MSVELSSPLDSPEQCTRCFFFQTCDGELRIYAFVDLLKSVYFPTNAGVVTTILGALCEAYKPHQVPKHLRPRCRLCSQYTKRRPGVRVMRGHGYCEWRKRTTHHGYIACEHFQPRAKP